MVYSLKSVRPDNSVKRSNLRATIIDFFKIKDLSMSNFE